MHPPAVRRSPEKVMRLERLGSLHQSRLSFMRILMRKMSGDDWTFSRPVFDVDGNGVGHAVYTANGPERSYSLVAFAHDLPADQRSDRVIAEAWDATFALFDGVPTEEDIARLSQNVPFQEAGRVTEGELCLSRANRSVRLWTHVVDRLASGQQPEMARIEEVGYLMRTTAVYGSGKFGAADRETIADREEFQPPFQPEMLTVYLIRAFVRDLVDHMAREKGGDAAVALAPEIARRIGIGNSTGLGMAPFIINHPILFNNWIMVREEAIARVRHVETPTEREVETFLDLLERSRVLVGRWRSEHPLQQKKLDLLAADLAALGDYVKASQLGEHAPWDALIRWSETRLSVEGQELVASLILEPYPQLVDGLTGCMADSDGGAFVIDGAMSVGEVRGLIRRSFEWAFDMDWSAPRNCARAWYVSAEKLEPRMGERFEEPVEPYEQPLAPARDAALAERLLSCCGDERPVSEFLARHPEHRHTVRRAQMSRNAPYAELRDNTISADVLPIDLLRAKLSFFGATQFDPRSDRWVRICMFAGAPYPDELTAQNADLWVYPDAL